MNANIVQFLDQWNVLTSEEGNVNYGLKRYSKEMVVRYLSTDELFFTTSKIRKSNIWREVPEIYLRTLQYRIRYATRSGATFEHENLAVSVKHYVVRCTPNDVKEHVLWLQSDVERTVNIRHGNVRYFMENYLRGKPQAVHSGTERAFGFSQARQISLYRFGSSVLKS